MLDSGAIVAVSRPDWALSSLRFFEKDKISDDVTALITHKNTSNTKWWHYYELVRAGGNNKYHILLDENLGGLKYD